MANTASNEAEGRRYVPSAPQDSWSETEVLRNVKTIWRGAAVEYPLRNGERSGGGLFPWQPGTIYQILDVKGKMRRLKSILFEKGHYCPWSGDETSRFRIISVGFGNPKRCFAGSR